jgi:hypothetical protein
MDRNWQDYKGLHSTIEGARAAFENDCHMLLQKMHPDKNVKIVRADPGDEGIDIYVGNIGVEPIDVYQCKFFLGPIGESQKGQIRESFDSALSSELFVMNNWYLLMPVPDLNMKENIWWGSWKKKKEDEGNINLNFINGNELINLLKVHKLYEIVFRIEEATKINHIHDSVNELLEAYKSTLPLAPNVNPNFLEVAANNYFGLAFALRYKPSYEEFYVTRQADRIFTNCLKSPKNAWIYGRSGVGKTVFCSRNIAKSGFSSFYCYLNAASNTQDADSLLELISENITLKYEAESQNFYYKGNNVIKKLVKLLQTVFGGRDMVICVDEVPISNDVVFKEFISKIGAICTEYANSNEDNNEIKFIISTINNPKLFSSRDGKMSGSFMFVELPEWSEQEIRDLYNAICSKIQFALTKEEENLLLSLSRTPRVVKDSLYQYIIQNKAQEFSVVLNEVIAQN